MLSFFVSSGGVFNILRRDVERRKVNEYKNYVFFLFLYKFILIFLF